MPSSQHASADVETSSAERVPLQGLMVGPGLGGMIQNPAPNENPLAELLHRAQAGEEDALEELLIRLQQPVLVFLKKRLDEPRLHRFIEDVVSEVLIRIFKHYAKCEAGTDREMISWVLSIAHNEALRLLSRRPLRYAVLLGDRDPAETGGRRRNGGHDPPTPGGYSPFREQGQRSAGLEALLKVLSVVEDNVEPELALILYLKLVEDRSWEEIGSSLEITPAAAKRRYQRAQHSLEKKVLGGIQELPPKQKVAALEFLKRVELREE